MTIWHCWLIPSYVHEKIYYISKTVSGVKSESSDTSSSSTYESQDYNYDSANSDSDYNEEPQPSLLPSFTTEAQHFKVAKGRLIRLPCRVDNLGKSRLPCQLCSITYRPEVIT